MLEQLAADAQLAGQVAGVDWARLLDPDMLARLAVQIVLLAGSAFFSGSEVALFSLSRMDLNQLRRARHPQAHRLYALLDQPRRLIISILCGNEFLNVAAAANMAAILLALAGEAEAALFNLLIMVPLLLLVGEVTPKTIAISDPVRISTRIVARPMSVWVRLVAPLRWVIRLAADRLTTLIVGEDKSPDNLLVADEVRTLVRELQETGELQPFERELVDSLLQASTTEVVEIMVPRTRMGAVSIGTPVPEAVRIVRERRQQRVPVYRENRDDLVGFLYAEELMTLVLDGADLETQPLEPLLHPVVLVPSTKKLDELLQFFREEKVEAAAVINEFGGVDGMVSMRQLVDFVFDPVSGPATAPQRYEGPGAGIFDVPGDMQLGAFNDLTGFSLDDPRMTTVGGVVLRHVDRLPEVGDRVSVGGVRFEVLAIKENRIEQVRATRGDIDARAPEAGP